MKLNNTKMNIFKVILFTFLINEVECKGHHSYHHSSHHSSYHHPTSRYGRTYYSRGRAWRHSVGTLAFYMYINGNRYTYTNADTNKCGINNDCNTDKGCCEQDVNVKTLQVHVPIKINKEKQLPIFDSYYIDTELSKELKQNVKGILQNYSINIIFINELSSKNLIFTVLLPNDNILNYTTTMSLFNKTYWGSNNYNITDIPTIYFKETIIYGELYTIDMNAKNIAKLGIFKDDKQVNYDLTDSCANNNCQNNAICYTQRQPFYICDCNPGFYGKYCEKQYNVTIYPCKKNEIYENGNCQCRYGYYGKNCDEVDECKDVNCNYGHCIDYIGKFECDCDFFFKGLECDEKEVYFYLFLLIGFLISCFLIKYLLYCLMQCINNCGNYIKLTDENTTENP